MLLSWRSLLELSKERKLPLELSRKSMEIPEITSGPIGSLVVTASPLPRGEKDR